MLNEQATMCFNLFYSNFLVDYPLQFAVECRTVNSIFKGWFPVSRNFCLRTWVKFTFANKIEAVHERWLVTAKFKSRSTSRQRSALVILPLFYVSDYVNVRRQKRVNGNQDRPLLSVLQRCPAYRESRQRDTTNSEKKTLNLFSINTRLFQVVELSKPAN